MDHLPPIVLECPECGEKYLISRNSTTPFEQATTFSDGFYIDEINWRTPLIIGCVTCELGFFPQCGKIIAEPDWKEFHEKWSHLKKAEPPTAGSLAIELRIRKNMEPEVEKALRREFWYAGSHSENGRKLMLKNEKFKKYWNESLIKLEELLSADLKEEVILKAEINRQLRKFDQCFKLLKNDNSQLAAQIKTQAQDKNSIIFQFS